jgi:transcriptional regulator with XRE-family HTH domain
VGKKQNIGKIIREQRKRIPLSLSQLSRISGVSVAHLGRVEHGQRIPSPHALQRTANPLGFDLNELLIMAGHLLPESSMLPEEQRDKLRAELNMLLDRVRADSNRIKEITDRLSMTG